MANALRVLYYLHRHRTLGLRYERSSQPLSGFTDSNWDTRYSTTGWLFSVGQATISWASKRQQSVALSSCEAEIMAASEAAKEGVYLRRFAAELDATLVNGPTVIQADNKAAIDLAYNPEHHQRTKHIDRRHFFILCPMLSLLPIMLTSLQSLCLSSSSLLYAK